MGIDESLAAEPHGFTLAKRRRWPYIVGAFVVIAGATSYFVVQRGHSTTSANETAGATLDVVYLDSSPAEKAIIEYIAANVAPDYNVKVGAVGLGDRRYAGTIFQHRHWLQQVLDANPSFQEQAATGPFFDWVFGIWSDKHRTPQQIPDGATCPGCHSRWAAPRPRRNDELNELAGWRIWPDSCRSGPGHHPASAGGGRPGADRRRDRGVVRRGGGRRVQPNAGRVPVGAGAVRRPRGADPAATPAG